MTPQEHTLLEDFLGRLQAAGAVSKDAEADAMIRSRLEGRPDAAYLLVQRCLLVERALAEANKQIDALRQQTSGAGGSFLSGAPEGFGRAPSQAYAPHMEQAPQDRWQQQQAPASAPAAAPGWRDRWFGGGGASQPTAQAAAPAAGPSFLGQAATTAAGVAGGMFLFNGIEHLIGGAGHNNGSGFGNNLMGGNDAGSLGSQMTENVTENVFIDNGRDSGGQQQGFLDGADSSDNWADNGYSDNDYSDDGDSLI